MCGIVGQISLSPIQNRLVLALEKLEYRGYDSSGIALQEHDKIEIIKSVGEIKELKSKLNNYNSSAICGIAHTRWATHGKVCESNSHPHSDYKKNWAVVHNGIIENFEELKLFLSKKGYIFYSQTDTEVIPNLINYEIETNIDKTIEQNFINACNKLIGSFSILAINKNVQNTIFIAKNKCPIYICKIENDIICSSDAICFDSINSNYYSLEDKEFCIASSKDIIFLNNKYEKILKTTQTIKNFDNTSTKLNFKSFAKKEIYDTPNVVKNIINNFTKNNYLKQFPKNFFNQITNIKLVGCGTSYHACLQGQLLLEHHTLIHCQSHIASEFIFQKPILNKNTLCVFVSQSGETADTLLCIDYAKKHNCPTLCLINVPYSTMSKKCDYVIPLCSDAEIAVVSTKCYSAMIIVFYVLAKLLENLIFKTKNKPFNIIKNFLNIPLLQIDTIAKSLCEKLNKSNKILFIGKCADYITACESSLKLKEITYINSISIPSGELKHGSLALIDKNTYVFIICTNKEYLSKNISTANEIHTRGGKVIFVSNLHLTKIQQKCMFYYLKLETLKSSEIQMISSVIFFQLFAVNMCEKMGYNPDKPRNLAKSVTVE